MTVDDDLEMTSLLKEIFNLEGLDVISANNGQEALNLLETCKINPNLILSDITMPIMNGTELLSILKNNLETKNIPFILSSALTDTKTSSEALGATACLSKPYNLEKLIRLVKTHLH